MIPVMRPHLGEAEVAGATAVIRSGWVAQGPRVAEFEQRFVAEVGAVAGVAVSSCTTGLHLLLHALGVGEGDDVVVPSLSFIASSNAPRYVGARPVFAEVELETSNVSESTIEAALTPRTKAVLAVHQIGMPLDLDPIRALCDKRGIPVIEDAACAIGSTYRGSPIGSGPTEAVFSFHPRKILTTGEGGMITTADEALASRLRQLRQHAMSVSALERHRAERPVVEKYPELGFNFRMTDIQAAIGIAQLGRLGEMVTKRRRLAAMYAERLANVDDLTTPSDPSHGETNFQSYSVILDDAYPLSRDALIAHLLESRIATRRGVMASHLEPAFGHLEPPHLPVTEFLAERSVILPLYHDMSDADVDRVAETVATAGR